MPKFQGAQQELQSTRMLSQRSGDRPSFQADIDRGLFRSGHFQVFAMPQGLLCLELRHKNYGNLGVGNGDSAFGGLMGAMAAAKDAERYGSAPEDRWEAGFELAGEEQLLELARTRRKSFVCKLDEIRSISIDAPGLFSRMFGDGRLAGLIKVRDQSVGKFTMEIRDPSAMSVAVDALPRRFGDRVQVHVAFDSERRRFVAKR
jgi:hypothetical protein